MIDRQLRKALRATVLGLSDQALTYVREEIAREQKRRRLAVRERRRAKLAAATVVQEESGLAQLG